jgi:hypothetical protein
MRTTGLRVSFFDLHIHAAETKKRHKALELNLTAMILCPAHSSKAPSASNAE